MKLLEGRIASAEAYSLGLPFGQEYQRQPFVVSPIPETDPLLATVEAYESLKELHAPKAIPEEVVRMGIEARGVPTGSTYEQAFRWAGADLARKYNGAVRILPTPDPVETDQKSAGPPGEEPSPKAPPAAPALLAELATVATIPQRPPTKPPSAPIASADVVIGETHLSERDRGIHDSLGEETFRHLTNAQISLDKNLRKVLLRVQLKPGTEATKASLDRIRRAKGYPLSREITNKRSTQK